LLCFNSSFLPVLNIMFSDTEFQIKTIKEMMASDKITTTNSFEIAFLLFTPIVEAELCAFQSTRFMMSNNTLFKNVLWVEREIWEMFGLFFFNHPTLSKLLLDYNFFSTPLLKTFVFVEYIAYNIVNYSIFTTFFSLHMFNFFFWSTKDFPGNPALTMSLTDILATLVICGSMFLGTYFSTWLYNPTDEFWPLQRDKMTACSKRMYTFFCKILARLYEIIRHDNTQFLLSNINPNKIVKKYPLITLPHIFGQNISQLSTQDNSLVLAHFDATKIICTGALGDVAAIKRGIASIRNFLPNTNTVGRKLFPLCITMVWPDRSWGIPLEIFNEMISDYFLIDDSFIIHDLTTVIVINVYMSSALNSKLTHITVFSKSEFIENCQTNIFLSKNQKRGLIYWLKSN